MKALEPLLQKEVSRKEFLTITSLGLASLFGLGTVIKLLSGKSSSDHLKRYAEGYGASDYGGKQAATKRLG